MTLFPILSLISVASAQVTILVSHFEGIDPATRQIAAHLPSLIEEDFAGYEECRVVTLRNAPPISKASAVGYMLSCPPGQFVGCTFVVGQAAKVRYAITGRVRPVTAENKPKEEKKPKASDDGEDEFEFEGGSTPTSGSPDGKPVVVAEIDVSILDVEKSAEILDFVVPYRSDNEATFASGIGFSLLGVVQGEVGQQTDIRAQARPIDTKPLINRDEVIKDLDALTEEMGEVEVPEEEASGPHREVRPHYTLDEMIAKEGKKRPWEKMGLTPSQYVSWWNSGWDIDSWRDRLVGRKSQLMIRPVVGAGTGPVHQRYLGRYALDAGNLEKKEVYALQETTNGFDLTLGVSAGYGILPTLEAEAGASVEAGGYEVETWQEIYGGEKTPRIEDNYGNAVIQVQGGLRWVPMPTWDYRPMVGLGVAWWHGTTVESHTSLDKSYLPTWPAPWMLGGRMLLGVETSLSEKFGLYVQVPMSLVITGYTSDTHNERLPYVSVTEPPAALGRFSAGFQAGAEFRFGSAKARANAAMDRVTDQRSDDEDDEENP